MLDKGLLIIEMKKRQYSAENGLKVLEYLGITITEQEKQLFKENWDCFYKSKDKDLIATVWALYERLPKFLGKDESEQSLRDRYFENRLEKTRLAEKLQEKSLEEISS